MMMRRGGALISFTLPTFLLLLLLLHTTTTTFAFQQALLPAAGAAVRRRPSPTLHVHADGSGGGDVERRGLLRTLGATFTALATTAATISSPANALRPPSQVVPPPPPSVRPYLWQVLMSDPPQLQPYTNDGEYAVLENLARKCNAIFLGEHPDSVEDHALSARLIDAIRRYKPREAKLAVGLEMVQQKFQPALDAYVSKTIADEAEADKALKEATEWDSRWSSAFEIYLPVLHLAREKNIRLLAVGLESEALSKVRQVGLEGLSEEERGYYVADPSGFIQSVKQPSFKLYAERFIMPSYAARANAAQLGATPPSPAKFLAARILWDESMATKAVRHLKENPNDIVVMLVAADHVKFGMGAPARLERLLKVSEVKIPPGRGKVRSILLNPTPEDTGSQTRRLRLTLGYAANLDNCRPLSDYLWFSDYPKVAWLEHPQNPISTVYTDEDTLFQVFSGRK